MKLEVVLVPVSDVDRAKSFYQQLGWRLDADFVTGEDFRVVQMTPTGSACSIIFGTGLTSAAPGSLEALQLTVFDIDEARADLVGRGIDAGGSSTTRAASSITPDEAGARPAPEHADYGSSFSDPDGNSWLLQEIKTRLPGR